MARRAISDRERLLRLAILTVAMAVGGAVPDYYEHKTFHSWLYFSFFPIMAGVGVVLAGFLLTCRYRRKLLQPPQGF